MKRRTVQCRAVLGLAVGFIGLASGAARASNANPGLFPPNSSPYGKSYAEWQAAWWQWAFSIPVSMNPSFDPTGALANVGQSGPVFYLPSVIGLSGTVERNFHVPAGKAILSPILSAENDNNCVSPPLTVDQLRAASASALAYITEMHASVDGVSLSNLQSYRSQTPVFSYTLPAADNIAQFFGCNVSGIISPVVSDGFYFMLAPLSSGHHDIRVGGTIGPPINFSFDVVDHITVGP